MNNLQKSLIIKDVMKMKTIKLSVHGLVDYLLRRGSIDTRVYNNSSMAEGTRIHLRYQAIQDGNYLKEEYLELDIPFEDVIFTLNGRADGIIVNKKRVVIDEIKSTVEDLETFYNQQSEWHLGQAICYAYIYAKTHNLSLVDIRLTYISQKDESKMIKNFTYTIDELEANVFDYLARYLQFYHYVLKHKEERKKTAEELKFPYDRFRKGQKEMAKYVYSVALNHGLLFLEAPTGIGKTMSTLFPSIKTFADEANDKIFYLTAKNSQKDIAFKALKAMKDVGLAVKGIKITSKEKMCQCESRKCNPDDCPFAKDYYEKINQVILEVMANHDLIDESILLHYAYEYTICPFEMQLDLSLICDVILCDYNYVFDPLAYLKRYFEESKTDYMLLIDEAHNLVDRSRDMYSTEISSNQFIKLKKSLRRIKEQKLKRTLNRIITYFTEVEEKIDEYLDLSEFDNELIRLFDLFFKACQEVMKERNENVTDDLTETFKQVNKFLKLYEFVDDDFRCLFERKKDGLVAKILCLSSIELIKASLKKVHSAIFFSATLTPMDYFIKMLGGDETTPYITFDSPFPQDNLCLLVQDNISTTYKKRANSYHLIAESIEAVVSKRVGNYLVFFSSYAYLNEVLTHFKNKEKYQILIQESNMNNNQKDEFLAKFQRNSLVTTIGFAVLGGSFSEGIDLVDDLLIGAIIVGVGLPSISYERNLIKEHFEKEGLNGYDYAYLNPGMNKVMQAAGRVIRSEEDKGIVLLIDERFTYKKYQELFKKEWSNYRLVYNNDDIGYYISSFWLRKDNQV